MFLDNGVCARKIEFGEVFRDTRFIYTPVIAGYSTATLQRWRFDRHRQLVSSVLDNHIDGQRTRVFGKETGSVEAVLCTRKELHHYFA